MGIRGRAAPPHPGIYRVPPREVKTAVCRDPEYDVVDPWGGSFGRRRYYLSATVVELTELFIRRFFTFTL